ncbi:hypothetical protein D049_3783B, partial [Vibrio parahaemolyticus VPTS-2010]
FCSLPRRAAISVIPCRPTVCQFSQPRPPVK